ncbi:MAG TPA: PIG-L deacetylase family protein [Chloroflexota bacterium]
MLVVTAHPDDAEFGCAGTVARLAGEGKDVFYAIVTDGSKGSSDPEMTPERLSALREQEQRDAAHVLGVRDVSFLGFPDGMLEPTLDVRKAITACIRLRKPDVVITQSPIRDLSGAVFATHPDHLAAGEACFAAVYPCARDRLTFPDLLLQGLEPHAVKELWVSGTSSADHFIDISSTLKDKIRALKAHDSQVGTRTIEEFIPERARQMGARAGMNYAEGYKRIVIP